VDLGIKETALVHISELSDQYIKDPMDVVKVGDVLEFRVISLDLDRRRIGLSRKSKQDQQAAQSTTHQGVSRNPEPKGDASSNASSSAGEKHGGPRGEKKRVIVKRGDKTADRAGAATTAAGGNTAGGGSSGFRPASGQTAAAAQGRAYGRGGFNSRADDDGTMYNPFAEALRKMQEKKEKPRKK
jgi:uncharacterized protein